MWQDISEGFIAMMKGFGKVIKEYQNILRTNSREIKEGILINNVYRIVPFSIILLFLYWIGLIVNLIVFNGKSFFPVLIVTILFSLTLLFFGISVSKKSIQSKINQTIFKKYFYSFILLLNIFIIAFTYIDVLHQRDINSYTIFLVIIALYPIMSLKEIITATIVPTACVVAFLLCSHAPTILLTSSLTRWIISIIISQILFVTYHRTKKYEIELENLNKKLMNQVGKDCLTHLLNRQGLQGKLDIFWPIAIQKQVPVATLLIDVDHFKTYNDKFGHQAGDDCLIAISECIEKSVKKDTDIVCRFGGEEFLIFIYNITDEKAIEIGERLRKNIQEQHLTAATESEPYVTISVGISTIVPTLDQELDREIKNADQQLYYAKKKGRNCISFQNKIYR